MRCRFACLYFCACAELPRTNSYQRLVAQVTTLDQLNGTLSLLEEIHDMENKIDAVYLPIENMYDKLRSYDLRLARAELKQVKKC